MGNVSVNIKFVNEVYKLLLTVHLIHYKILLLVSESLPTCITVHLPHYKLVLTGSLFIVVERVCLVCVHGNASVKEVSTNRIPYMHALDQMPRHFPTFQFISLLPAEALDLKPSFPTL